MIYIHIRFIMNLSRRRLVRLVYLGFLSSAVLATFATLGLKIKGVTGLWVDGLAWYAYTGIGLFSFLLTLLVITDTFLIIRSLGRRFANSDPKQTVPSGQRRLFLKKSVAYSLAGGTLALSGAGVYGAKKTPAVKDVLIPVNHLHPDLDGFSIVQITDIHLGSTIKKDFLERVVAQVNALSPDIVALTGDLVDGYVKDMGDQTQPLLDLTSVHGNFFVTGNHEYYFNALQWIEHMELMGFTVFNNSHRLITQGQGRLLLAGVTDLRADRFVPAHRSDPVKAMENAPDAHIKILLAHQPKSVFDAARAGFDVQLSGHTHGGQFFPWNLVVGLNQPFMAGPYRHENVFLHVSRGTGYWGPPMRLGSPSEITRVILKSV